MLPQTELRYYFATYFAYTWINHLTCVAGLITHKGFSIKLQRGPKSVLTVGGKEQVAKEMFCWGLASVFLFFHSMFLVNPAYPHVLKQRTDRGQEKWCPGIRF